MAQAKNVMVKKLEQGYKFSTKAGEAYEELISMLNAEGVKWGDISKTLINLYGSKWPQNGKGKPVGIKAALDADYEGAKALNRFNAYRSATYSDYGVPKGKKVKEDKKDSEGGSDEGEDEDTKGTKSDVNKFSRDEIALYLAGMEKMVESEEGKHALRILKDEFGIEQA